MTAPVPCPVLSPFDPRTWSSVRGAFSDVAALPLMQAWGEKPEERFRPADVRVGVRDDALWVLAELDDDDVFNPVTAFNEAAFQRGDVFEMFFAPAEQSAYFEFHVTPGNARLQLRFPQEGAARAAPRGGDDSLGPFTVGEPLFESWTDVRAGGWSVLAKVPFASIIEGAPAALPRQIHFSFCRYDWTRGCAHPVLSSTSPHSVCDFHRIEEWGILEYGAGSRFWFR